jgi:hypothetical protein
MSQKARAEVSPGPATHARSREGGYVPEAGTPGGPTVNRWGGYFTDHGGLLEGAEVDPRFTGSLCPKPHALSTDPSNPPQSHGPAGKAGSL